jgi:hypothetical protein
MACNPRRRIRTASGSAAATCSEIYTPMIRHGWNIGSPTPTGHEEKSRGRLEGQRSEGLVEFGWVTLAPRLSDVCPHNIGDAGQNVGHTARSAQLHKRPDTNCDIS